MTSIKNPKVAAAVRLKKRAFREADRRFLVEGAQGVGEALEHPDSLMSLFVVDDLDPLAVRARHSGVDVHEVSPDVMAKLTSTVTPQGIVGVSPFLDVGSDALPVDGCVAVLHEVRDPGNAGTVLRSADAAGAGGVVFTSSSVDAYNPKTVRSSAGSIFHLPIARGESTTDVLGSLRDRGMRVLAMDGHGDEDLYAVDLGAPIAFVFGNEAHGLPPDVIASADATVRVPHQGKAESLNLAAAASVCLFEWARRRHSGTTALETIVAAAAHDIRSPLTAMKGFGYALEKRWNVMTEEQRALMLRGIVHDADRMDAILRLLVDAGRVAARQPRDVPRACRPGGPRAGRPHVDAARSRASRGSLGGAGGGPGDRPRSVEECAPGVRRGAGVVGTRGTHHDRGRAGRRSLAIDRVAGRYGADDG